MTERLASAIQTVAIDMAGTTVVDDGLVEGAFARAWVGLNGAEPPAEAVAHVVATMGQSKIDVFRALLPEAEAQRLNVAFEEAVAAIAGEGGVAPIAGAEEVIARLRGEGRAVVLTTGFARPTADAIVAALGWGDLVDGVITPADAGRGRPAPDVNLAALLRTRADAVVNLAVVGDTPADAQSGVRAGAGLVIAVRTGGRDSDEALRAAGADEVIASIADLPDVLERSGR